MSGPSLLKSTWVKRWSSTAMLGRAGNLKGKGLYAYVSLRFLYVSSEYWCTGLQSCRYEQSISEAWRYGRHPMFLYEATQPFSLRKDNIQKENMLLGVLDDLSDSAVSIQLSGSLRRKTISRKRLLRRIHEGRFFIDNMPPDTIFFTAFADKVKSVSQRDRKNAYRGYRRARK